MTFAEQQNDKVEQEKGEGKKHTHFQCTHKLDKLT